MKTKAVNQIVIVGGGTSGWMSAAYLSQELGTYLPDGVKITLIEASDIPTVGVGEGTFPSLRTTLAKIGIDEADFIREADATFKQGLKFVNWHHNPDGKDHFYYHLFEPPRKVQNQIDIAPYWLLKDGKDTSDFADDVSVQQDICENRQAPKTLRDQSFFGPMNYAYHLDAGKFAELLKKKAKYARVEHIIGKVETVQQAQNGDIQSVTLKDGKRVSGDLFIDCTGFLALLIEKTLGVSLEAVGETLFVDSAVTVRVPYAEKNQAIPSATVCTAHEAGWSWDIGLKERRGIGYVYSSKYSTPEHAEKVLRAYVGDAIKGLEVRHVPVTTGYRKAQWKNNCIAVGLSAGFLEPLEATGIALIEKAVELIAGYFPRNGGMEQSAEKFNTLMNALFDDAVVFIKMHCMLSQRDDTPFWTDNRKDESIPQTLKKHLKQWEHSYPKPYDFDRWLKMFGDDSYQYVLLGMGFKPDLSANTSAFQFTKQADAEFENIRSAKNRAAQALPSHRDLINSLHNSTRRFGS